MGFQIGGACHSALPWRGWRVSRCLGILCHSALRWRFSLRWRSGGRSRCQGSSTRYTCDVHLPLAEWERPQLASAEEFVRAVATRAGAMIFANNASQEEELRAVVEAQGRLVQWGADDLRPFGWDSVARAHVGRRLPA